MKNKTIYVGIIAVVFIAALIITRDKMDIGELIGAFTGASGILVAIWNWIAKEEIKEDFIEATSTSHRVWRENKKALLKNE